MSGISSTEGNVNSLLTPEDQAAKFTGAATHDGEPLPATAKQTEGKAKGVTPSKAAREAAATKTAKKDEPEGDEGEEGDGETVAATPAVKSAQDRINKAVAKQRIAERERDALTKRLDAMEARLNAPAAKTPLQQQAAAKEGAEPKPEDYTYGEADVKFIRDTARWEVRQELAESKAKEAKTVQTQQLTAAQTAAVKALDDFYAKGTTEFGDDFRDAVTSEDIKITQSLAELLLDSDHGVDIAWDIASDPDLGKKVSAMTASRQAAWFGSYEEQNYSSDSEGAEEEEEEAVTTVAKPASTKPTSRAPKPPVHKNRGGGKTETNVSGDTNDFAAFERQALKAQR